MKEYLPNILINNDYIHIPDDAIASVDNFVASWTSSHLLVLGVGSVGAFGMGIAVGRKGGSAFRRITSVHAIQSIGEESPLLRGKVVSVSDGDTLRFYHRPTWFHSGTLTGKVSEQALPIRICTIDTPEVAKFGKPGQPFGDEAKDYLSQLVLDKTVVVQVLQRDQYGRAVATVAKPGVFFGKTYLDEAMLKAGLAEVYLGGGAVYGPRGKEYYLELMEKAKSKKKGMWSKSNPNRETAAQFKALMKEES